MPTGTLRRRLCSTTGLFPGLGALALVATMLFASPGAAAPLAFPPPAAPIPALEPTPGSVQDFLDTRVLELLEEHDVPGAAVSVVADGEQVASGAYGHADSTNRLPLTEDHRFPTGSVAKSFTAAAVLQLVDEGVLDLGENINTYLPAAARVSDTFDEKITLHHLLTHTAGFEDRLTGTATTDPADLVSLEEYIQRTQVDRVQPPGRYSLYSNHGLALAGYIVELRSQTPFAERLRTSLFEPLGMADTAFTQPAELDAGKLPTPHHPDGRPAADLYLNQTPAGSAVTTTTDMSRFMLALLGEGELDGERVLSSGSAGLMLEPQWFLTPEASGIGYGTWEYRQDPPRVVGHMGDLPGYHTDYFLVPEAGLGLFVASNSVRGPRSEVTDPLREFRLDLRRAFLREFAPPTRSLPADPNADVDLDRYTGTYLNMRLAESESSRIRALGAFVLVDRASGGLTVLSGPGTPLAMRPAGKGVFVSEDGQHRVVFREGPNAAVAMAFEGNPITTYERVGPVDDPLLHQAVLLVAFLLMATCLVWPVTALVRGLRRRAPNAPPRAFWARATVFAALSGTAVTFGAVGYLGVDPDVSYRWLFEGSLMLTLPLLLTLPFLVGLVVWAVMAWRGRWWSVVGRIHYSLIALAGVALLALGVYYRLIWPLG